MPSHVVTALHLNLRSAPDPTQKNVIVVLPQGTGVDKIANSSRIGWFEVDAVVAGTKVRGHLNSAHLGLIGTTFPTAHTTTGKLPIADLGSRATEKRSVTGARAYSIGKSGKPRSKVSDDQTEAATIPVVLLLHGIRDFALWQNSIRHTLEENGFVVEPLNYGRFNLLKFLAPISIFRRQAIKAIEKQVEIVIQNNPDAPIHVIAHSFGTYVVSLLMRERFNLRFHRVIFCGSVVPFDFDFEQVQDRFARPIINEVGTRDIWPALAESVTTGYGSSGTYGFRRPLVRDRWHNGAKHGYFLDRRFCTEFWIPFLRTGEIVKGDDQPESTPIWLNLLHIFKMKYAISLLVFAVILLIVPLPFDLACGANKTARIRQNIVQLERPLIGMGSSAGYSAGNREQWLALLDGLNADGDEVFSAMVAELRTIVMGASANGGDNNYNMFVSNEMSHKLQDLRTTIENAAAVCSLTLP
ncbi:hypothetical protein P775_16710 [Puniceibacterium antarcticum]|uniref:Uncharacterized protein n=1 Tax=Puniceibacterium antarcticum TaxID=1206336 RepID=A0A2G8RBQ6_9RHOB|nr:hypothetical protein [Puniceibacterium antarcticum]PIL19004.1 hypothetical protein P775_16710 [Puniceibacterium antarcticum]